MFSLWTPSTFTLQYDPNQADDGAFPYFLSPAETLPSSHFSLHSLRRRPFLIRIRDNGWRCTGATDNSTPLARRELLRSQIFFTNASYMDFCTADLHERVSVCAKCVQFVCGSQDHAGNEDRREARSQHTSLIER